MRVLPLLVLLVACTDAAEVPSTVAHIKVSQTCVTPGCTPYGFPFYDSCGPMGSTAITATTRDVEVLTSYDAADITGYVQLQYESDAALGTGEMVYTDQLLMGDETVDVYASFGDKLLYKLTADGEVTDIDTTVLTSANGNTLQFQYTAYDVTAQEEHVIDAARPIRLETDDPGLSDACCSVGDFRDGGLVLVVLVFGLRRRRHSVYSA